jgi:hypothetical protein
MYKPEARVIENILKNKKILIKEIIASRIYLNSKILDLIEQYLELGNFSYSHTGGMMSSNYNEKFFKNLLDKKRINQRKDIYKKIRRNFSKLHLV